MGTTLTGTTPQDTYDSLIKVTDNGPLTGSLKKLTDGLGNDSSLSLSTTAASLSGTLAVTGDSTLSQLDLVAAVPALDLVLSANTAFKHTIEGTDYSSSSASLNTMTLKVASGSSTQANVMTLNGAGNVGIGTSSPATRLHVAGTDAWLTLQRTSGTTNIIDFTDSAAARIGYVGAIASNITINAAAGNSIIFAPNNAEAGRFTANGLTFNGDTAAANALDDYEEGTFTPTAFGATTAGTTTYNGQNGYYTKIGRQVTASLYVSYSSMTGTGTLKIGGLPFAIGNLTENYPVGSCIASAVNWTGGTYLQANGVLNESNLYVVYMSDGASANVQDCVNESSNYRITITYFTA
jgi:hypothetical protein